MYRMSLHIAAWHFQFARTNLFFHHWTFGLTEASTASQASSHNITLVPESVIWNQSDRNDRHDTPQLGLRKKLHKSLNIIFTLVPFNASLKRTICYSATKNIHITHVNESVNVIRCNFIIHTMCTCLPGHYVLTHQLFLLNADEYTEDMVHMVICCALKWNKCILFGHLSVMNIIIKLHEQAGC